MSPADPLGFFYVNAVNKVIYDSVFITCTLTFTSLEYIFISDLTGYHPERKKSRVVINQPNSK